MGKRIWQYPEATSISENDYLLLDNQTDGSKSIKANLVGSILIDKTVTERKTYTAADDNVDGYKKVIVDVPYTDVHYQKGDIVTFEGEDFPLKSLKTTIVPIQDLHGYDSPWVGGAGKNKFNDSTATLNNLSKNNGIFTNTSVDGRTSFYFTVQAFNGNTLITNKDKTVNTAGRTSLTVNITSTPTTLVIKHSGSNTDLKLTIPFTQTGTFTVSMNVTKFNPSTVGGLEFKEVMIEEGSSMTSFAPYSNICPISGWSGCNPRVVGDNWGDCADIPEPLTANIWQNVNLPHNTYTISFDVVNAVKTALGNTTMCAMYNGTTNTNILLDKIYSVEDGSTYLSKGANVNGRYYFTYTGILKSVGWYWRSNTYQLLTSGSIKNIMIEVGANPTKQYTPYNGATYTIPFTDSQGNPIEVFGGECDVVNGSLDENQFCYKVTSDTIITKSGDYFEINNVLDDDATANYEFLSSFCKRTTASLSNMSDNEGRFVTSRRYLAVKLPYSTVEEVKTYLTSINAQIVYTLPTSTTLQQQPTSIKSIEGTNNVWGDCGPVAVEWQTLYVTPTE